MLFATMKTTNCRAFVNRKLATRLFFKEAIVLRESRPYNPPDDALETLARCIYPAIRSYFESEEGQREFEEWKSRRDAEQPAGKKNSGDNVA